MPSALTQMPSCCLNKPLTDILFNYFIGHHTIPNNGGAASTPLRPPEDIQVGGNVRRVLNFHEDDSGESPPQQLEWSPLQTPEMDFLDIFVLPGDKE